ncbi:hypothetical protein RUM44_010568 [Polyplax serrata]|uniref:Uncharacterized protein n=1 Tax=Polyplax serrata TaxID=468196 RepID=A0ABR1AWJ2_POLSC
MGLFNALNELVNNIRTVLPENEWQNTGVLLFISPKIRFKEEKIRLQLTSIISKYLKENDFVLAESEMICLNTEMKLAFSWMSLNFALGNGDLRKNKPIAAVSLLAFTSAIAYIPEDFSGVPTSERKNIFCLQGHHQFYWKSSPWGQEEIRKKILQPSTLGDSKNLETACVSPHTKFKWTYNSTNIYVIRGRPLTIENTKGLWPDPEVNYEKCCAEVNAVVSAIKKPPFVKVQELYALKFYNALAGKVQLKTFNGKGSVTLREVEERAREVCADENDSDPFICMDMVFMHLLFKKVYGLKDNSTIHFCHNVNGVQVHWALSMALYTVRR